MELVAARYMARFRCLGGACEDTCCRDWRIPIDKEHHDALTERMSSPAERAELAAAFRPSGSADRGHHMLVVLEAGGCCHFLDADRLCSLHRRFGEELLPDTCASYPRVVGRIGSRAELVGSVSCPEVARQLLFAEDGTEMVPAEPELFGRGVVSSTIDARTAGDYERCFFDIRELALALLRRRDFPLASRLYFLAVFADRSRSLLRRGVARIDLAALGACASGLDDPSILARLQAQLTGAAIDDTFAMSVVRQLLSLPAHVVPKALHVLLDEIAPRFPVSADVDDLQRAYAACPPLPPELAARLDLALERYAVNHILGDWYVHAPSFVGYIHGLLARVAVLRVLVRTLIPGSGDLSAAAFDALVVRAVYAFSRMLEHNAELASRLIHELERQGMTELDHAIRLIRQ